MPKGLQINPPFFNIGPKAYAYGEDLLQIARTADRLSRKYSVDIIFTPQTSDIRLIADNTENLFVFAQHIDPIKPGGGHGHILPEAVAGAGAQGTFLNHGEKPMTLSDISRVIKRAEDTGLKTVVCTDTVREAAAVSNFNPNIVLAERTELIGTGETSEKSYVEKAITAVKNVNSRVKVMHGGGISSGKDVDKFIRVGVEGVGAASGIMRAGSPRNKIEEMLKAVRRAWDDID